jgi:hypothetical protein
LAVRRTFWLQPILGCAARVVAELQEIDVPSDARLLPAARLVSLAAAASSRSRRFESA